ncbi:hypothetical protein LTR09_010611 [Extremus antarcticus]|uniref:C2H2-type domain-containing protein n=1 Tax=Extremus antarcticus TaxID=702011 RepID=A0AAJ0D765_9PEZI|nr:hypothetical protein LTR09_010611 [Extremus antarcticus]
MDNNPPPPFFPPTGNKSANYQPENYTVPCMYPGCGRWFVCDHNLEQHIRERHTHERPYACDFPECGKRFSRPWSLSRHLRLVHKFENAVRKAGKGKKAQAEMEQLGRQIQGMLEPAGQVPGVPVFDGELLADDAFQAAGDANLREYMEIEQLANPNYREVTSFYDLPAHPYAQPPPPHHQTDAESAFAPPNNAAPFDQPAANYNDNADVRHHCPFCIATYERPEVLAKHFHRRHGMAPHPECGCEDCVVLFAADMVQQYGDQMVGYAQGGMNGINNLPNNSGDLPLFGNDLFQADLDVGAPPAAFDTDAAKNNAGEQVQPAVFVEENGTILDNFDNDETDLAYHDPAHHGIEEWLADAEAARVMLTDDYAI